jgi:hypothetical protein
LEEGCYRDLYPASPNSMNNLPSIDFYSRSSSTVFQIKDEADARK